MEVKTLRTFKLPFKTRLFNENQKVWIVFGHGQMGYCVIGKHRGKGRYIQAFVNFDSKAKEVFYPPKITEVEVNDEFLGRLGL